MSTVAECWVDIVDKNIQCVYVSGWQSTILLPEMDNANDQLSTAETSEHHFGTKYKRTLDSDEEDDEVDAEKYNVLDNEEIEGMEKATVDFDGDIKITPFNMDEELETGHFDKEGTYIFEKQQDIHDNWLDNIDWTKVKGDENKDSDDDVEDKVGKKLANANELYRQVLELIQPMESIQKAIQRYGKTIKRTKKGQPKWKKARNETKEEDKDDQQEKENKDKMMKLISIADQLLSETGDMEIYEKKYEEIQFNLKKSEPVSDMFGDDFDDEKNQGASTSRQ